MNPRTIAELVGMKISFASDRNHVPDDDLWTFLVCTVRYAMGRESYISGLTCDLVRRYRHRLRPDQVEQIAREVAKEIELAEKSGRTLGADMDHREWVRLVEDLTKEGV